MLNIDRYKYDAIFIGSDLTVIIKEIDHSNKKVKFKIVNDKGKVKHNCLEENGLVIVNVENNLVINDKITIRVIKTFTNNAVRLGIIAPDELSILKDNNISIFKPFGNM